MSSESGPELPMQVVHPYPTRLKPSRSSGSVRPARSRYSVTTFEPGASEVLTHGLELRPRATALRARMPAPIITDGLEVLVQLVIAAITTWPWSSSKLSPPGRPAPAPLRRPSGAAAVRCEGSSVCPAVAGGCPGAPFAGGSDAG